jgi:hypothetical protein
VPPRARWARQTSPRGCGASRRRSTTTRTGDPGRRGRRRRGTSGLGRRPGIRINVNRGPWRARAGAGKSRYGPVRESVDAAVRPVAWHWQHTNDNGTILPWGIGVRRWTNRSTAWS